MHLNSHGSTCSSVDDLPPWQQNAALLCNFTFNMQEAHCFSGIRTNLSCAILQVRVHSVELIIMMVPLHCCCRAIRMAYN